MNPLLVGGLLDVLGRVADKVWPDPAKKAEAQIELLRMQQAGELADLDAAVRLALAQAQTNTAEAASGDAYAARWRPTIGYVLAAVLGYSYIAGPVLQGAAALFWPGVPVPDIHLDDHLWELMLGMLGLAGWRTLDKIKGRAS